MHTGAKPDIIDAGNQSVQTRLLDEQQAGDGDDAARDSIGARTRQHPRGDDNERSHLGRAVNVSPAVRKVSDDNDRNSAQKKDHRGPTETDRP